MRCAVSKGFWSRGLPLSSPFAPRRGPPAQSRLAPFGRVPAHALRQARPGNAGRCARRPAANFLQVQLGHPRGGGDAGLRGRRGREAKAKAAASAGAGARWAEGRKGSQSGSRACCQSRGFLQSHPCYFQNLGPTVQLRGGVRSANRWRTEWEREWAELGGQDKEVKERLTYTCFWGRAEGEKNYPQGGSVGLIVLLWWSPLWARGTRPRRD